MSAGFGWILLAVLVYGVIHSILASLGAKTATRQWLGVKGMRFYRLGFNGFAGLSLLPILYLVARLPDAPLYTIPLPWVVLTGAIQGVCAVCFLLSLSHTGARDFLGLDILLHPTQPAAPQRLATAGFYRYTRHPLYFFGLVILWMTPLMTWNILSFSLGATGYIIIGALVEERKLLLEFGAAYAEYRRRTPFLIPFIKIR